jgi:UDP-N-acetylglucosamine/UDP-N-acetylgalactosamine diphosphorylase
VPEPVDRDLAAALAAHGQEHVLRFWARLDAGGRERLTAQLRGLDLDLVDRLVEEHIRRPAAEAAPPRLEPPDVVGLPRTEAEQRALDEARREGDALLRDGKVAVLTVAGGQGSRLGFDGPKGAFPIGPVTGMTLFELFARAVRAVRRGCCAPVPWLVMTSETNHEQTTAFFAEHGHFGLPPESVRFFTQGMLPSVDLDGKLLLAAQDRVAVNPNGHGGTLLALRDSGVLDELQRTGVEVIHYFQVDNPLVAIADPVFLGLHRRHRAEMSSKAVEKTGPDEKVGVFAKIDGRLGVIEYSDLDPELARAREPDGALRFGAGSIAIHAFDVAFVDRITRGGLSLPYHKAVKKVAHIDAAGIPVEPEAPNAVKFETFVFDALGAAERAVTMMVRREEEFSPVKNATGVDSVATAKAHLVERAWRWLRDAGVEPPPGGDEPPLVEIDPLFAHGPHDLEHRLPAGMRIEPGTFLEA